MAAVSAGNSCFNPLVLYQCSRFFALLNTGATSHSFVDSSGSGPVDIIGRGDFAKPLAGILAVGKRSPKTPIEAGSVYDCVIVDAPDITATGVPAFEQGNDRRTGDRRMGD